MKAMVCSIGRIKVFVITATLICVAGCGSVAVRSVGPNEKPNIPNASSDGFRILAKSDLDHIINAKLSRQEATSYLRRIRIENYDLQDPNTNWSHADFGGYDSGYGVYYLTYRQRYFILLLADEKNRVSSCIDIMIMPRPSPEYELGMGQVEINKDHFDSEVIVVYNKNWKGSYSDDIVAAFRPNLETKRIEEMSYKYIRIYREE
jgi:hypothetical protein